MVHLIIESDKNNIIHYYINWYGEVKHINNGFVYNADIYTYNDIKTIDIRKTNTIPTHFLFPNLTTIYSDYPIHYDFIMKHNFINCITFNRDKSQIIIDDLEFLTKLNLVEINFRGILPRNSILPKFIKLQSYSCLDTKYCNGHNIDAPDIHYEKYDSSFPIVAQNVLNKIIEFSGEYISLTITNCSKCS